MVSKYGKKNRRSLRNSRKNTERKIYRRQRDDEVTHSFIGVTAITREKSESEVVDTKTDAMVARANMKFNAAMKVKITAAEEAKRTIATKAKIAADEANTIIEAKLIAEEEAKIAKVMKDVAEQEPILKSLMKSQAISIIRSKSATLVDGYCKIEKFENKFERKYKLSIPQQKAKWSRKLLNVRVAKHKLALKRISMEKSELSLRRMTTDPYFARFMAINHKFVVGKL